MTYVSVVTLAAYALVLALLAVMSVVDVRERRIPNVLVAALAGLWLLWRLVLGLAGQYMGLGFKAELLSPAPTVMVPPGLEIAGESLAGGILGAVVLGGGLLVMTALYEGATRKESFGGGDIKLMAVLGLFLGWERGLICLLAACVLSVVYAVTRRGAAKLRRRRAQGHDGHDAAGQRSAGAGVDLRGEGLAATMPFGPFIAAGTLMAFVA